MTNKIKGKIILQSQIECLSPMHIGSGTGSYSDMDIIRDADGRPVIPSAGFIGVLRRMIKHQIINEDIGESHEFKNFWGYAEDKDGMQSALCCSDLNCIGSNEKESPKIVIRDGICIDNATGMVKSGGKYDFELLESGNRFKIKMEFTYRKDNEDFVRKTASTILKLLAEKRILIGAKTNNGFGRIGIVKDSVKIYLFDFSSEGNDLRKTENSSNKNIFNWLTQNFSEQNSINQQELGRPFSEKLKRFSITTTLRLKNSLIVRSYSSGPKMPDAVQLKSLNKDWVIPGSSLKGAIRARAERIVNTLGLKNADTIITELFGNVCDEQQLEDARKGRIRVQEIYLSPKDFIAEQQTRIKIDRFTNGAMDGCLFNSMPIFIQAEGKIIEMNIEIDNYKEYEPGLLLLVLKDLWSGDLPVGGEKNIGRGVFRGVKAKIVWHGEQKKEILLEEDLSVLTLNQKSILQGCVDRLVGGQN